MKFGRGLFGWVLFIGLAIMLFMLLSKQGSHVKPIPLSEFMNVVDPVGRGAGRSKKDAEQAAAEAALDSLQG